MYTYPPPFGVCAVTYSVELARDELLADGTSALVSAFSAGGVVATLSPERMRRSVRRTASDRVAVLATEILKAKQSN